jgi:hypothetical protein
MNDRVSAEFNPGREEAADLPCEVRRFITCFEAGLRTLKQVGA